MTAVQAPPMTRRKRPLAPRARRRRRPRDLSVGHTVLKIDLLHAGEEILIRQAHRVTQERPQRHVRQQHSVHAIFQNRTRS
jgi:hypothetical protein